MKSIKDLWDEFSSHTLKGMPTTHPLYLDFKMVYHVAIMDALAYQHNVLGDANTPDEVGAATLEGWHQEIHAFLGSMPGARKKTP